MKRLYFLYFMGLLAYQHILFGLCDNRMTRPLIIDTLCTLSQCCQQTEQHFVETFTALQEFQQTVTICCDDILVSLSNATISCAVVLDDTFTTLEDINNTLTACCASFESTLTEIISLLSSMTSISCPCVPTPIDNATTISVAGSYCLANDIVGQITIASDNVVLDLNDHEISAATHGIVIANNTANVIVRNGSIRNTTNEGILVQDGCNNIEITALALIGTGGYGVSLAGTFTNQIHNCLIDDITSTSCAGSVTIVQANSCVVQKSNFNSSTNIPINISDGNQNNIINCAIKNNSGIQSLVALNQSSLVIHDLLVNDSATAINLTNCPDTVIKRGIILNSQAAIQCFNSSHCIFEEINVTNATNDCVTIQNSPNSVVANLIINNTQATVDVINITNSSGCCIDGCQIVGVTGGMGAVVTIATSDNVIIENIYIDDVTASLQVIHVLSSADVVLHNCLLSNIADVNGVLLCESSDFIKLKNISINKVTIGAISQPAVVRMQASVGGILEDISCYDISYTGATTPFVIFVDGASDDSSLRNILVNRVASTTTIFCIELGAPNLVADSCIISDIAGVQQTFALDLTLGAALLNFVTLKNIVISDISSSASTAIGVSVGTVGGLGSSQVLLTDSIIYNCQIGYRSVGDGDGIGNNIVFGCSTSCFDASLATNLKAYNNYAAKSPTRYAGVANVQLLAAPGPVVGSNIDGGA